MDTPPDDEGLRDIVKELQRELDTLRETVAELQRERDQTLSLVQQPAEGQISRRAFVAAVSGAAGVGMMAADATAAPSFGSSSGKIGTDAEPLTRVVSATVRSQTVRVDETLVLPKIAGDPSSPVVGQIWYDTNAD